VENSRIARWLLLGLAWLVAGTGAAASQTPVDLTLVLAVDASGSVDAGRFNLQKQGYADAFANPKVLQAIRSGPMQAIGVAMVQWTGPSMQSDVIGWTVISDKQSADEFAAIIRATPRRLFGGGTSLSGAIDHSVALLAQSPFESARSVIDVSGDGSNNSGRSPRAARDAAIKAGIGINGLPILSVEPGLDRYYRDNVIGGPGAFVIAVDDFDQFADAILSKLVAEIAGSPVGASGLAQAAAPPAPR
jgi:hypothetical protein